MNLREAVTNALKEALGEHAAHVPWEKALSAPPKPEMGDVAFGCFPLARAYNCLLYTSPSPRDGLLSRMPSSA